MVLNYDTLYSYSIYHKIYSICPKLLQTYSILGYPKLLESFLFLAKNNNYFILYFTLLSFLSLTLFSSTLFYIFIYHSFIFYTLFYGLLFHLNLSKFIFYSYVFTPFSNSFMTLFFKILQN